MSMINKMLGIGAAAAAMAAAAPASAQYYSYQSSRYNYAPGYGYAQSYAQPYGYRQPYAQPYGYAQQYGYAQGYGVNSNAAAAQCTAAVQNRLYNRSSIGGILGAVLGANTTGRVVSVTQVNARNNGMVRVKGLASSGRYAAGPYGVGAYGALGYNAADLNFRCDVAPNGAVYSVDINRR